MRTQPSPGFWSATNDVLDDVWLAETQPNLHAHLASRADAPARARVLVSAWCGAFGLDSPRCDTLRLLVTEVVTNAVVHPRAARKPVILLAATLEGDRVLVTVTDTGTGPPPSPRDPDPSAGGFGLFLLDQQALRWGVDAAQGCRVWFEI
jgi:anti-sigma regulatory factor (Ser/Thr protein kinase)